MDSLFSDRSIWTMIHGLGLSGTALLGLAASVFSMYVFSRSDANVATDTQARALSILNIAIAILLWASVLIGTYLIFPLYRATPPEGTLDLAAYPRAMILANESSAWLHRIGMEIKEHVPWIAAMLATAAAFVSTRYRSVFLRRGPLRTMTATLLVLTLALVAVTALLGTLINKFAPLE